MTKATNLQLARNARLPGVETTSTISSSRLTKRIFNSTRQMLATGNLTGGWTNQSRRLARTYMSLFEVPYVHSSWMVAAHTRGARMPEDVRAEMVSLIHANYTLWMMDDNPYMRQRAADHRDDNLSTLRNHNSEKHFHHLTTGIQEQVAALLAGWLVSAPETQARKAKMLTAFDSGEVLPFDLESIND